MVGHYNDGMGGVDLLDNMVACYRVLFRVRKWWFPFYTWSLSVSAVAAWRLRMKVTGQKEPFLDFLRELVIGMLAEHGHPPLRRLSVPGNGELRYDGLNHWIASCEQDAAGNTLRRNCKACYQEKKQQLKTSFCCEKCKVPLHTGCFKERILYFVVIIAFTHSQTFLLFTNSLIFLALIL